MILRTRTIIYTATPSRARIDGRMRTVWTLCEADEELITVDDSEDMIDEVRRRHPDATIAVAHEPEERTYIVTECY